MTSEELDAKVLTAIRAGDKRASKIHSTVDNGTRTVSYREVDRSLQRLRRSGKAFYESAGGWGCC